MTNWNQESRLSFLEGRVEGINHILSERVALLEARVEELRGNKDMAITNFSQGSRAQERLRKKLIPLLESIIKCKVRFDGNFSTWADNVIQDSRKKAKECVRILEEEI